MNSSLSSSTHIGITVLRVSLGVMWIAHALLKLFVFTLPGTAQYFASVGFPGFLACPVFAFEIAGGVALLLGFYARQVALALVPVMAGAAWVHLPNGWTHTSAGGGWEYPVFLIASSIALWLLGTAPPRSSAVRYWFPRRDGTHICVNGKVCDTVQPSGWLKRWRWSKQGPRRLRCRSGERRWWRPLSG